MEYSDGIFRWIPGGWRQINGTSVFFRSMASEKVSNRSKNGLLSAPNDKVKVGASEKSGPAQTGFN